MNINRINSQKGIAQFLVIAVMAFMALGIPTATKLVQQNQENRSKAAEENSSIETTPTKTPTPIPITVREVSLFHNFAPKNYSPDRKIGTVLTNDIVIKTSGTKIDSATIVYCYTDLLKPNLDSVSGEQIAKVVSNKEIGNNCAELKVVLNDKQLADPLYQNYKDYALSYKATIVKYGKGTLKIDCTKSSLLDKNGEKIVINDPNCGYNNGTQFTLTDQETISPTPIKTLTPTPRPISGIKVSPETLKLKIGQSQNLTYILTPGNSTDTVKWEPSNTGMVRIQKITTKCSDNPNTKCMEAPGINHLQVTALKAGTVKIKLTTGSGKSAEATVVITDGVITTPPPTIPGAYLYFNPRNQSHKIGDTFEVTVGVNSDSSVVGGADVVGIFDSSKLELISIKKSPSMVFGDKGDCYISKDLVSGKFSLSCYVSDSSQAMAAKGDLVNLTFKAKSAGSAKIEFACEQNNNTDSNIISSNPVEDKIVCGKNINANIVIMGSTLTKIDGKCSTGLNKCLSGTFKDLPDTNTQLIWQCSGINGGKSVKCSTRKNNLTTPEINENGVCGDTTKIITNTCVSGSPVDLSDTVGEYVWQCKGSKTTDLCVKIKGSDDDLCPKNQFNYWGKCENDLEIGWGCDRDGVCISGKCDLTTNRCVSQNSETPATNIRISPLVLNLKVGQSKNLTSILTPSNSTDKVAWSNNNARLVTIKIVNIKCPANVPTDGPYIKCIPGKSLQITALKPGTVKIKAKTSSGKTAEATVVVQK